MQEVRQLCIQGTSKMHLTGNNTQSQLHNDMHYHSGPLNKLQMDTYIYDLTSYPDDNGIRNLECI